MVLHLNTNPQTTLENMEHLLDIVISLDLRFEKLLIIDFDILNLWNNITALAGLSNKLTLIQSDIISNDIKSILQLNAKDYDFVFYPKENERNSYDFAIQPVSDKAIKTLEYIATSKDIF